MLDKLNKISCALTQSSLFQKLFRPDDSLSFETFLFRIRIAIWIFLFIFFGVASVFPSNRNIFHMSVIYTFSSAFMIYLSSKGIKEDFIGLIHVILTLLLYFRAMQNQDSYLRFFMSSFPTLALFSLQLYSTSLLILMMLGLFYLKYYYRGHLDNIYDAINNSYQLSNDAMNNFQNSWVTLVLFQIGILCLYQYMIRKTWNQCNENRKKLEETQNKLQEINFKLTESLEELDIKHRELQKASKAQDLFVACVSHELRNPLNVMLGNIDILAIGNRDSREIEILKTCKLCGEALLRQINNLLDVSKMNANKFELNPTQMNSVQFFEKFWAFAKIGIEKKHLQGLLLIDKSLPQRMKLDEHRLHQVLDNLISNAIKFTSHGIIRVIFRWIRGRYRLASDVSLEEISSDHEEENRQNPGSNFMGVGEESWTRLPRGGLKINNMEKLSDFICFKFDDNIKQTLEEAIPPFCNSVDNFLRIEVADAGCGISEEAQKKLFQPFVQASSNVSSVYGGTGLGLYIVKSIVERMGGSIRLTSLKDVGTRFQILIPIKEENFQNELSPRQ